MFLNTVSLVMCQIIGKSNEKFPMAPLKPIPACSELFNEILIDYGGPLPKIKSGNNYLLTIMCRFICFPETIILRNVTKSWNP